MSSKALDYTIAIDWGSTSFRAYLLDNSGQLIDKNSSVYGVFKLVESFENTLKSSCAEWFAQYEISQIYIAGMAGSRNGWLEAAYVACPANENSITDLCVHPNSSLPYKISIIPGVMGTSPSGFTDVMRGEETQLLGVLDENEAVACLPGTHSKWVHLKDEKIQSFATLVTGELFELVQKNSSIGSLISDSDRQELDEQSFELGVKDFTEANEITETSLLHSLFSVRAKAVTDQLNVSSMYSYLSGMIIADEVYSALKMFKHQSKVILITDKKLRLPYEKVFKHFGIKFSFVESESAFLQGMKKLTSIV